jgi:hypothetical protein
MTDEQIIAIFKANGVLRIPSRSLNDPDGMGFMVAIGRDILRGRTPTRTLDPHKIQICRVAPIDYDNGQPCACPEGTCNLWKGGLKPLQVGTKE